MALLLLVLLALVVPGTAVAGETPGCVDDATAELTVTDPDNDGAGEASVDTVIPADCDIGLRTDGRTGKAWSMRVYDAADASQLYFCQDGTDPPPGEEPCTSIQPSFPPDADVTGAIVMENGLWRLYVHVNHRQQSLQMAVRVHYGWKGAGGADCPDEPALARDRWDRLLDQAALKNFFEFERKLVRRALRKASGERRSQLARLDKALGKAIRKLRKVPSADFSRGAGGLSKEDLDKCVDGLIDNFDEFAKTRDIKDKPASQVKALLGHLTILKDLLDPEKNKSVKPEDKKKILEDSLVALVKQLGGTEKGELAGNSLKLYKVLTGQLDKPGKEKAFKDAVTALAKKVADKQGGELAKQVLILFDVVTGNLDAAKRDDVLKTAVLGLITKIGEKGYLNLPQIKAFVTGYELMAPFANYIVRNLVVVVNRGIYTRCLDELETAKANFPTVEFPGPGVSTGPWKNNPVATSGWSCATYNDPDTGRLTIQAVSPAGKWVILYDYNTGETVGQTGGP
jgi:hypothetical protein